MPSSGTEVEKCRLCGCDTLSKILSFPDQPMSGIFPLPCQAEFVPTGPLGIVACADARCGLVQLSHTYEREVMYGDNYGYRTGLNSSMKAHVREIATYFLAGITHMNPGEVVIDIGSNDCTLLDAMPARCVRIGVDPTISKFKPYYLQDVEAIAEFFPSETLTKFLGGRKAKVVTSVAMFYDVDDPIDFARCVREIIAPDGVWFLELAYLPLMVKSLAFDSICHEHSCYYGLRQLKKVAGSSGFHIANVWLNDTNGGSIAIAMTPSDKQGHAARYVVDNLIDAEYRIDMLTFKQRVTEAVRKLRSTLEELKAGGAKIVGLGASTKGNVLLTAAGLGPDVISCVGDVNGYKHGRLTATGIPIVPESEALAAATHAVVLPWHFRDHFVTRIKDVPLIFPLPQLEIVLGGPA